MSKYLIALALFISSAFAEDLYVAQSALGTGDGLSASNAKSVSFFNTAGNWGSGAGKISSGDTVHLVGTITTQLIVQASGASGSPITVTWELGAKLSQPAGTLISLTGKGYIVFDGGADGIIECTANGTLLANQIGVSGIYAQGCSYVEVKNLTIRNLYVHESASDTIIDEGANAALYLTGATVGVHVSNCMFSDVCWAINTNGAGADFIVEDSTFVNYDHGVASGTNPIIIRRNHFGTTANWDTTADKYHHDGIHIFFGSGQNDGPNLIERNVFDGNWGSNNTAHIFIEGNWNHVANSTNNFTIRNNVHIQYAGNVLNNGFANGGGTNWVWENNTYVGQGVYNSAGINLGGTDVVFRNNLVTAVHTFVSAGSGTTFVSSGLTNNVYANQASGGNTPFYLGTGVATLGAWQTVTGQDANSLFVTGTVVEVDGHLPSGSVGIGAGTDLSTFFSVDCSGITRSVPWDIGAYVYIDTTPPMVSALINSTGMVLTLMFNEPCVAGTGGTGGITLASSGGLVSATYLSGAGTSVWQYAITGTAPVLSTETLAWAYFNSDGIQDLSGNLLSSQSSVPVNNSSAQYPAASSVKPRLRRGFIRF